MHLHTSAESKRVLPLTYVTDWSGTMHMEQYTIRPVSVCFRSNSSPSPFWYAMLRATLVYKKYGQLTNVAYSVLVYAANALNRARTLVCVKQSASLTSS